MAGGREGKGGRSGRGGEINPRGVKARRGKEEGGGLKGPQKKPGSRFQRGGGLWKPWVEGLLVVLAAMGCPGPSEGSVCVFGSTWEHLGDGRVLVESTFGLVQAGSWVFSVGSCRLWVGAPQMSGCSHRGWEARGIL